MKKCLAFVLKGGGARGALEVGALRALLEQGYQPDLLAGTSIGAVNAAGLAVWGVNRTGVERLEWFFKKAANSKLLERKAARITLRSLVRGPDQDAGRQLAGYLVSQGFPASMRFGQIEGVRLALVAADLDTGLPIIYGRDPEEKILDGILASCALPPWFAPIDRSGHVVTDGGFLSNLPIEAALTMGATEIIALTLDLPLITSEKIPAAVRFIDKLGSSMARREMQLEMALAEANHVPVRTIHLKVPEGVQVWDFPRSSELIQSGYEMAKGAIAGFKAREGSEQRR